MLLKKKYSLLSIIIRFILLILIIISILVVNLIKNNIIIIISKNGITIIASNKASFLTNNIVNTLKSYKTNIDKGFLFKKMIKLMITI